MEKDPTKESQPKPEAIIFDAFDTLLSDGVHLVAEQLVVEMELSDKKEFWQLMPSWQNNWRKLWLGEINEEEMKKIIVPEIGERVAEQFFSCWRELTKADPKMTTLVETVKKEGGYKFGLLVNTPPLMFEYVKQEIPLDLFDTVLASCEVGLMKPDLQFYRMMIDRLGVQASKCLYIDDNQKNILGGEKVGMQTVQFKDHQSLVKQLEIRGII